MRGLSIGVLAFLICLAPAAAQQAATADKCDASGIPGAEKQNLVYLSAHVDSEGRLSHGVVVKSSGNAEMDKAALDCLEHSNIGVGLVNDIPIEFDWTVQFRVKDHRGIISAPNPDTGHFNSCFEPNPRLVPINILMSNLRGTAKVKFRIATDGSVIDPAIVRSSGSEALDGLSLTCLKNYKYFPAFQGQKRIEIEWTVEERWSFSSN